MGMEHNRQPDISTEWPAKKSYEFTDVFDIQHKVILGLRETVRGSNKGRKYYVIEKIYDQTGTEQPELHTDWVVLKEGEEFYLNTNSIDLPQGLRESLKNIKTESGAVIPRENAEHLKAA